MTVADDDARTPPLPLTKALGQMIVARYVGDRPPAAFTARVRRGEIGGVILFGDNVRRGPQATLTVIDRLQRAAHAGGHPPLLVAIDQEGGEIRRINGPPARNPRDLTSARQARAAGHAAGRVLRRWGVNLNLAPVADVPTSPSSFLSMRAFGGAPTRVAERACAFTDGLHSGGVGATLKHFPGLGAATTNTDLAPTQIDQPPSATREGYAAYQRCGNDPRTLVMVSSAVYPRLTGTAPAVMSRRTYARELQRAAPGAVTISDDLETPAIAAQTTPGRRAINAGLALLLYARTEASSAQAYPRLLADARAGRIVPGRVRAAAERVVALKVALGQPFANGSSASTNSGSTGT
ncbi:MAG: glycoside hydrolase family 3 protein [Solirubrobacteraceae bacterium]|nr:glycoside hydrolase family 3 protein [Solirubrobacteraceae bacterium]